MKCSNCNNEILNNTNFCPVCGHKVEHLQNYNAYDPASYYSNLQDEARYGQMNNSFSVNIMSYKDFLKSFAKKSVNVLTIILGVMCFLSAAIELSTTLTSINYIGNYLLLICMFEVVFMTVMGILILINKKWYISLIITIYAGISFAIGLALNGKPSGFIVLIIAVGCTVSLYKVNKSYKIYTETGQIPPALIG